MTIEVSPSNNAKATYMWKKIWDALQAIAAKTQQPPHKKFHIYSREIVVRWVETKTERGFLGRTHKEEHDRMETLADFKYDIETMGVSLCSRNEEWDDFFKQMAMELAKSFKVKLFLATYKGEGLEKGISCQYCGRFTEDATACTHCGGKPI